MPNDRFYHSPLWRRLRAAALARDHGRCVVPGCGQRATHVDHIVSRHNGGPDTLANLRSLCREHDNAVMQDRTGKRRSGGKLVVRGCYADGTPRDPTHPWNRPGGVQTLEIIGAWTGRVSRTELVDK